jgi:hypothetical protein
LLQKGAFNVEKRVEERGNQNCQTDDEDHAATFSCLRDASYNAK